MEETKFLVEYGVMGLLLVMSVLSFAIGLERFFAYGQIRLQDFSSPKILELALTKRLHLLAVIGSNAPYLGLLGTVLGIMLTFYSIGEQQMADTGKIMIGLALALKVTALGLVVAIPAIVMYSLLGRKVKSLLVLWEEEHARQKV